MNYRDLTKKDLINELAKVVGRFDQLGRIQTELRESRQRLELAITGADLGMWDCNLKTGEMVWSDKVLAMLGYSEKEIEPDVRFWKSRVHPEDWPKLREVIDAHLQGRLEFCEVEYRLQSKSGQWTWILARGRIVEYDGEGNPTRMTGTTLDITKRKLAEENFYKEKRLSEMMIESLPGVFYLFDIRGRYLRWNKSLETVTGYSASEISNMSPTDFFVGEDKLVIQKSIQKAFSESEVAVEAALVSKDGTKTPHLFSGRLVTLDGNQCLIGMGIDISERKRTEERLKESEEKYRVLVEKAHEGVLIAQGGILRFANPRTVEILGFQKEELLNRPLMDFLHPDDREMVLQRHYRRLEGQKLPSRYEVRMVAKGGSTKWLEIDAALITWENKPAVLVFITDITDRRKAEEVQRRLATAVEQAAEAIVIADGEGTIQYVNPAFERITGYAQQEAIGKNPSLLKSGQHDEAFYSNLWATITEGEPWSGQFINKKKNGTLYREDATISPVRDASGQIVSYVAVKRDVTKEIELQWQLMQAQKMEAIGTLAGGVAHDFNNLLTIVQGYSELLLDEKEESDPSYADIQKIAEASRRGTDLVRNLLAFSRRADIKPRPMNLNHEVTRVEELLNRTIPKMIKIELHLDGNLNSINADPDQMGQVLMNLTVNAEHAMPEGGKLTIATANMSITEEYRSAHPETPAGKCVLLTVSDTGHGMDTETVEHIFEPFFTTKGAGKGSGLGLAMVYGIIQQHGGNIICESEPGRGTTFNVYLPAIAEEEAQEEDQTEKIMSHGGSEKILLVDDEIFLRDLGEKSLTRAGYSVLTAAGGPEALELYAREGDRIDLVILDLFMPEMGGDKCLEEILAINPRAKIIISSGAAIDRAKKETLEAGARAFVSKPFRLSEMLKTVREVLDTD